MTDISIESFLDFKYFANLKANPSKTKFIFTVAQARFEKNDYEHYLYVSDGKKVTKLLNLQQKPAVYWEDDAHVLFTQAKTSEDKKYAKDAISTYYRLNVETKEVKLAYRFLLPVSSIKVLAETGKLLLTADLNPADFTLLDRELRSDYVKAKAKATFVETFDELPFYFNGQGFLKGERSQAFLYDVAADSYEAIETSDFNIDAIKYDESTSSLVYVGNRFSTVVKQTQSVWRYDLKTKKRECLLTDELSISQLHLVGSHVLIAASDMKAYGINQNPDFYEVVKGQATLIAEFGFSDNNSVGSDVRYGASPKSLDFDECFWFVGTNNESTNIVEVQADGSLREVYVADAGSIDGLVQINDETYVIALLGQSLQEIYRLDLEKQTAKPLTRLNQKASALALMPQHFDIDRGEERLDGWAIYPPDFDATQKYPAILVIHGGPKTVYSEVYYHEMQVWASLGYVVLFTNPRGSDGRDDDFADIRGKYGTIDYDDLMAFVDQMLVAIPQIDAQRLGVTGGSYGGYMTNWIVGHTDRFRCAATQRSISNWVSFYGTSDIGTYFATDQNGCDFTDKETLWEHSPLKFVDDVKTPLLFIHSDQDYRCPIEQGLQFYSRLKINGIESRFVWFKEENHELSRSGRPQGRIKRLQEITAWMENHLK